MGIMEEPVSYTGDEPYLCLLPDTSGNTCNIEEKSNDEEDRFTANNASVP